MLVAGGNSSSKTHYEILSVREDAGYDEIRASYRSSLLIFHPDKLREKCVTLDDKVHDDFIKIQKAWEVLSDSKLRYRYDHELACQRYTSEIAEDIDPEEMTKENVVEDMEFVYPCRCGDCFSVTSEELEEMGLSLSSASNGGKSTGSRADRASVLLHCGSCSLKIKLMAYTCL